MSASQAGARRRSCSTSSWSPRKESDALGDGSKKTEAESKRTHSADNLSQSEGAGAPERNKPESPHKPRERESESERERESENLAGEDEPYELFQVSLHAFVRLFMCIRRCLSMHSSVSLLSRTSSASSSRTSSVYPF